MKRIGLTGGIGMGKSTAARILQEMGVRVVDTDELARLVVEPGQPALDEVRQRFGDVMIGGDGRLRRDLLAREVFSCDQARRDLEAILHPRIRVRWLDLLGAWSTAGVGVGVVVIPLLFETGAESSFDLVVSVGCTARTQELRLGDRGWTPVGVQQRIAAQWPAEKKMALAHRVIWTEGRVEVHVEQWRRVLRALQ